MKMLYSMWIIRECRFSFSNLWDWYRIWT